MLQNNNRFGVSIIMQTNNAYGCKQQNNDLTDDGVLYEEPDTRNTADAIKGETYTTKSVLDNNKHKAKLAKNECAKKWLAILVVAAFILSLLVAVAALVYTNIELKNQMSSTNKQVQSMNERLNNQSSQLSDSILALSSNISDQNKIIFRDLNDVQSIIAELGPMAFYPGARIGNSASSCSDIPQDRPSGEYWIVTTTSSPVQVYCDMNRTSCSCNTAGGWMRVVNLHMTDPNQNCPERLRLVNRTEPPLRTCGRMEGQAGCTSTTYSTYGVEYSTVCGRIIAYQYSSPDAFNPYFHNRSLSIDDVYVDGVSLTHGQSPRQHIWTFANALDETKPDRRACPCTSPDLPYTGAVPPFIGQDYFCETGSRKAFSFNTFYSDDPLWDSQGCEGTSTCCEFNNPPWFCKQLPQPTTDDIELRVCGNEGISNEDTPIEIIEMYVR